jgi:predicted RNase H-like HicB family nuclease
MRTFHYTVYREDHDFVAQCLDFNVSSFGPTEQEALRNLKEAIELYLEDRSPTEHIPLITNVTVGELAIT